MKIHFEQEEVEEILKRHVGNLLCEDLTESSTEVTVKDTYYWGDGVSIEICERKEEVTEKEAPKDESNS